MSNLYLIFLLLLPFTTSHGMPPLESFIYGGCSQMPYAPNSPFSTNLYSVLTSLVNSATYSPYNYFTVMSPSQSDVVHGLYQCRGDLSMPECASCVGRSVAQLSAMCPSSSGAAVQLQGCYAKYDNASFLGVEDKAIIYKKFGPSVGYDGQKVAAWDSVLAGLVKGASNGPYYRVAGSEDVRGVAQCVGDLSAGQCQGCVLEAVNQLKSQGGTAAYGDMFLVKCYARFSVVGSGGYSKSGSGARRALAHYVLLMEIKDSLGAATSRSKTERKLSGSGNSPGVKTFAVIVGLLAGVVILVIFFTFVCRTFAGSSK